MVSVWRPGFPVLRLFVVYIARARSNYCADATPTRGVWSQIQSLRRDLSRLCRLLDRSTPTRREGETSHLYLYITENRTHTLFAQHTDTVPVSVCALWTFPMTAVFSSHKRGGVLKKKSLHRKESPERKREDASLE